MASSAPTQDLSFDPARTALLVIDPVNDFLSDGGAAAASTSGTARSCGPGVGCAGLAG